MTKFACKNDDAAQLDNLTITTNLVGPLKMFWLVQKQS